MKPGDHVLVDGKRRARVQSVWGEGSTSYAFPHARVNFPDGDVNVAIALTRLTVVEPPVKMTETDNGHYLITERSAALLAGGKQDLPPFGYEKLVQTGGLWYWLARTRHMGVSRWALKGPTNWRIENGRNILRGDT